MGAAASTQKLLEDPAEETPAYDPASSGDEANDGRTCHWSGTEGEADKTDGRMMQASDGSL